MSQVVTVGYTDIQPTVWKGDTSFLVGGFNHQSWTCVGGIRDSWTYLHSRPLIAAVCDLVLDSFLSAFTRADMFELCGADFTGEIPNSKVLDNIEWLKAENHQPLVVWLVAHVTHHTCLSNRMWPHMARKSLEVMAIKPLHLMWDTGQVRICFTQEQVNFAEVIDERSS